LITDGVRLIRFLKTKALEQKRDRGTITECLRKV
jgi:hypothetical protein